MDDSEDVDSLGIREQVEDRERETTQERPPNGIASLYDRCAAREDLEASDKPVQVLSQFITEAGSGVLIIVTGGPEVGGGGWSEDELHAHPRQDGGFIFDLVHLVTGTQHLGTLVDLALDRPLTIGTA